MLWGRWVHVKGMHLRVSSMFEGASRKCVKGALEGAFEGVWGCLKSCLKVHWGDASENIKGTLECAFEGALKVRWESVWRIVKGMFEGTLRVHQGHVKGVHLRVLRDTLKGMFEAHLRVSLVGRDWLQPVSSGRLTVGPSGWDWSTG